MAIGFVGHVAGSSTNGNNITLNLNSPTSGSAPSVGNFVLIISSTLGRAGNEGRIGNALSYTPLVDITNTQRVRVSHKVFASGQNSVTVEGSGNSADGMSATAIWFSGVDGSSPFSQTTTTNTGSSTNPDCPAITPTNDNCMIVAMAGSSVNDSAVGTISNYTVISGDGANDNNDASTGIARRLLSGGSGSPENPAAFGAWASGTWVSATIALREPQALTAALYSDTDTFHASTVAPGAAGLTASLYSDTDTFYTPTVAPGAVGLTASLYSDGDTFHTPTVDSTYALTAPLFSGERALPVGLLLPLTKLSGEVDTFYVPTVEAEGGEEADDLTPSLYSDDDTFHTPTVAVGAVDLSASLYSDGDTFHTPTVAVGAVDLSASLYSDDDTFFTPTLLATYELTSSLYSDDDAFFSPTVSEGSNPDQDLTSGFYSNSTSFYNAEIRRGPRGGGDYWNLPWLKIEGGTYADKLRSETLPVLEQVVAAEEGTRATARAVKRAATAVQAYAEVAHSLLSEKETKALGELAQKLRRAAGQKQAQLARQAAADAHKLLMAHIRRQRDEEEAIVLLLLR